VQQLGGLLSAQASPGRRQRHRLPSSHAPHDARQRPKRRLGQLKRGTYSRRKAIVEPVFGQMDTTQDAKQLGLRGKPAARKQWQFHAAVHNLLKLHRNGGLTLIPSG